MEVTGPTHWAITINSWTCSQRQHSSQGVELADRPLAADFDSVSAVQRAFELHSRQCGSAAHHFMELLGLALGGHCIQPDVLAMRGLARNGES
jgi:hypothetical protein